MHQDFAISEAAQRPGEGVEVRLARRIERKKKTLSAARSVERYGDEYADKYD